MEANQILTTKVICVLVVNFKLNLYWCDNGYYPVDAIYPRWSIFVKTFSCPTNRKGFVSSRKHDLAKKDVLSYSKHGSQSFKDVLADTIYVYAIRLNMIIEDEGAKHSWVDVDMTNSSPASNPQIKVHPRISELIYIAGINTR